jgi:hypothetical protein
LDTADLLIVSTVKFVGNKVTHLITFDLTGVPNRQVIANIYEVPAGAMQQQRPTPTRFLADVPALFLVAIVLGLLMQMGSSDRVTTATAAR